MLNKSKIDHPFLGDYMGILSHRHQPEYPGSEERTRGLMSHEIATVRHKPPCFYYVRYKSLSKRELPEPF